MALSLKVISPFLLSISLVLICFAVREQIIVKNLLNKGHRVAAKVIDVKQSSNSDGTTYMPVFRYINHLNEEIQFERGYYSNPMNYEIGDDLEIVYSKESDKRKVVSFWGLYTKLIILISVAVPLFLIGGGYLMYHQAISDSLA